MMLCQNCNQRQATCHLMVSHNGRSSEAHLCAECANTYAGQYQQLLSETYPMMQGFLPDGIGPLASFTLFPGMLPTNGVAQRAPAGEQYGLHSPADPFGQPQADPEFKARRERELLHGKLRKAVATEDFETAAKLRDQIKAMEDSHGAGQQPGNTEQKG